MSLKTVGVGGLLIGGGHISVQSMTKVKTGDVENCVAQILSLEKAGCEIVRSSVLDEEDALAFKKIKEQIHIPIAADVHFSAKLAVLAVENGADKLRVNPGNLGGEKQISLVADCVKRHGVPVRVGANTGSIEKRHYEKYGRSAKALVLSALESVKAFERRGIGNIVISVKASDVPLTIEAYRLLSRKTEYPLHLGVTEAGAGDAALVKSAIGIGALLTDGIGDTIRVSLSGDPVEEVYAARHILRACGLDKQFVEVIACPTCGRCEYDCRGLAKRVNERVKGVKKRLKVAVMGCVVNGPGEAKKCDLGIAGGKEYCMVFYGNGEQVRVNVGDAERVFFEKLEELIK